MPKSQTDKFAPEIGTQEGRRYVRIRPKYYIFADVFADCMMCYVHDGICVALVQWEEQPDGMFLSEIYAPSLELAALVPNSATLVQLAELRCQYILTDLGDVAAADQVYCVVDMRVGKAQGRDYFFSTDRSQNARVVHLSPGTAYFIQKDLRSPVLSYDDLVGLVQSPPSSALVINIPPLESKTVGQLYDEGHRLIIEDMTAVERVYAARGDES